MNPAAPVWVPAANVGAAGGTPQRSTLDPNCAVFRPKTMIGSPTAMRGGVGSTPPTTFTRYGGGSASATPPPPLHQSFPTRGGMHGGPFMQPRGMYNSGVLSQSAAPANIPPPITHVGRGGTTYYHHPGLVQSGSGGQLYAAKANTHWGSGNSPSPLSDPSGTAMGKDSATSPTRITGIHEDVLFTSTTKDIWSGSVPVNVDLALDSALSSLAAVQETAMSASQPALAVGPTLSTTATTFDPSALLKSLQVNHSGPERDAGWSATQLGTTTDGVSSVPWGVSVLAPVKESLHGMTTDLSSGADAGRRQSSEDRVPVDTVQHLLAQLTRESPNHQTQQQQQQQQQQLLPRKSTTTLSGATTTAPPPPPPPSCQPSSESLPRAVSTTTTDEHHNHSSKKKGGTSLSTAVAADSASAEHARPQPTTVAPCSPPQAIGSSPTAGRGPLLTADDGGRDPRRGGSSSDPGAAPQKGNAATAPAAAVEAMPPVDPETDELQRVRSSNSSTARRFGDRRSVERLLQNARETLRHIKILSFSKQHPEDVAKLFAGWAAKGIPAPDDVFGAYYFYVAKKSGMELCMKHNGRGKVPGVGYGRCDFGNRGPNFKCRFHHVCLFCKAEDHGWFDESKCSRYLQFRRELDRLGLTEQDVPELVDAYDQVS